MAKQQQGRKAGGQAAGDDRDLDDIETEIDEALEEVDEEELDERLDKANERAEAGDPDEALMELEEEGEGAGGEDTQSGRARRAGSGRR